MAKPDMLLVAQMVVVVALAACVIAGHNSYITDALIAVSGSIAGTGVYEKIRSKTSVAE